MEESSTPSLSLHDSLSLGQVEEGLSSERKPVAEEVHRLPALLRLLSSSRPLSSIPSFVPQDTHESADEIIDQAVQRLEDRAVLYSVAEAVEVTSCHIAPAVCRKISKLPPLEKDSNGVYKTEQLSALAHNPVNPRFKRRKLSTGVPPEQSTGDIIHQEAQPSEDEEEEDEEISDVEMGIVNDTKRRRLTTERESFVAASEDSQEATVTRTLSELVSLVVQSLSTKNSMEEGQTLALTIDDSILAEARQGAKAAVDSVGGAMVGSNLGSTLVSLMHHAPVLRHRHVATALCRAAVPQTADLISRMGANCPAAVPSLLRGCIDVYQQAQRSSSRPQSIVSVAVGAIRGLAGLSDREKSRVRTILRQNDVLVDLQLDLAIDQDPLAAATLLIEHLSGCRADSGMTDSEGVERSNKIDPEEEDEALPTISLGRLLEENEALVVRAIECLGKEFKVAEEASVIWGRMGWILSAYILLFSRVKMDLLWKSSSRGTVVISMVVSSLDLLTRQLRQQIEAQGSGAVEDSPLDRPFSLLSCAAIVTMAHICSVENSECEACQDACARFLKGALLLPHLSLKTDAFVGRVSSALKSSDSTLLRDLVEAEVLHRWNVSAPSQYNQNDVFLDLLSMLCAWAHGNLDLDRSIKSEMDMDSGYGDHAVAFVLSQLLDEVSSDEKARRIKAELTGTLENPKKCQSLLISSSMPKFIEEATSLLLRTEEPRVPLVLPVVIESQALKVRFDWAERLSGEEAKFLTQLMYCFAFLELEPGSPFLFNPRTLPLKEVWAFCSMRTESDTDINREVAKSMKMLIGRHTPEVEGRARQWAMLKVSRHLVPSARQSKEALLRLLRKSISDPDSDPQGLLAERVFCSASIQLSDVDLYTATVSALVSKPHSPPVYITYPQLCHDPLVLLKCPLSAWNRRGLRRIILSTLASLMETNEFMIKDMSRSEETGVELLAARNELVARSLVGTLVSPKAEFSGGHCSMTTSVFRKIVMKQAGLVAMLIKQNLPESAIDWLVEFVPESITDSLALNNLLSERSTLTTAERLVAADGILRVAVAHGHTQQAEAETLVFSALSQLIASFFLIVGPVGVPVTALVAEGSGLDATQSSRRAAFRMLKCLLNVRGIRTGLRNECAIALQKLAGLCKGESIVGGVPGAIANRQKSLLKDLEMGVVKAANAMGSAVQL